MAKLEDLLTFVEKITAEGPIPEDHSAVAGRMILFNLVKSDEGAELLEDIFGLPFVRRDPALYRNLSMVCNILAHILEHGMPEDVVEYYSNCSENILTDMQTAVKLIEDECAKAGLTDPDRIAELKEASGIDVEHIDRLFTGWEPLENVHVV